VSAIEWFTVARTCDAAMFFWAAWRFWRLEKAVERLENSKASGA